MTHSASAGATPERSPRVRRSGVVAASVFVAWWLVLGVPPFWWAAWIVLFVWVLAAPGRRPLSRRVAQTPTRGRLVLVGLSLLFGIFPAGWLLQEAYDHSAAALVQRRVEAVLRRVDEWDAPHAEQARGSHDIVRVQPYMYEEGRIVFLFDGWRVAADPGVRTQLGALRELQGDGIKRPTPFWDIGGWSSHVFMTRQGSFERGTAEVEIDFWPARRDEIEIRWKIDPRLSGGSNLQLHVSVGASSYWGRDHWKPWAE